MRRIFFLALYLLPFLSVDVQIYLPFFLLLNLITFLIFYSLIHTFIKRKLQRKDNSKRKTYNAIKILIYVYRPLREEEGQLSVVVKMNVVLSCVHFTYNLLKKMRRKRNEEVCSIETTKMSFFYHLPSVFPLFPIYIYYGII